MDIYISIDTTADFFHSFPPQFMGIINRYSISIFRNSGSKSEFSSVYLVYCGRRNGETRRSEGQTDNEEIIINLSCKSVLLFLRELNS